MRTLGIVGALMTAMTAVTAAGGCDVVAPKADKPRPPPPGTWLSIPFPDVRSLNDVLVLQPGLAYAVGTDGTILKLTGKKWAKETSGTTEDLEGIAGFLEDDGTGTGTQKEVLLVVGHNGTVLMRTDPGVWASLASGTTATLFGVDLLSDKDGFIVGDAGTVLRFDGTALTLQAQQTLQTVLGLGCTADADCGGGNKCADDGSGNLVCHSFFPIPEPLKGVAHDSDSEEIAVGARGAVYTYDPTGEAAGTSNRWTRENANTTRQLASIFTRSGTFIPTTDGVLLARNGPGDYDDATYVTPAPVFLQDVWVDGGDVFAVGLSQEIFHRNGDGTWNLTTVAADAQMRGIDGFEAPPDDDPKGAPIATFIAVGAGGRIVRGPLVLPQPGEVELTSRLADADFIQGQ